MTSVLPRPIVTEEEPATPTPEAAPSSPAVREEPGPELRPLTRRAVVVAVAVWLVVTLMALVLVWYGLGPMLQARDQQGLLDDLRTEIDQAANEEVSLVVDEETINAPAMGDAVAIVDVEALGLRQVALEGVSPSETRQGPGHVPGTAGPGQPGNAALVGRRGTFGGPFRELDSLTRGDEILVTTTQGQSLYEVGLVWTGAVADGSGTLPAATEEPEDDVGDDDAPLLPSKGVTTDDLYGPSDDDRLTLVTSADRAPWATDRATVVVAELQGQPFEPTPQGGRTSRADGRSSETSAWPQLVLATLLYAAVIVGAVMAMRSFRLRTAYLLVAPPLVVASILLAESAVRLLPAWA